MMACFPLRYKTATAAPKDCNTWLMCATKGLAVILDVVYNHLGPEGNYLGAYGPYFTDKYNTPWGRPSILMMPGAMAYDVILSKTLLMWFRDFQIDALRLDAVHAIKDFSPVHILREMRQHGRSTDEGNRPTHYLIVELDLNDTRFINPLEERGYGMDAQWIDEFHHALRVTPGKKPATMLILQALRTWPKPTGMLTCTMGSTRRTGKKSLG